MNIFLRHILTIIQTFKGGQPIEYFLKSYFRDYPKLGSRDRRAISEAVYLCFRSVCFAPENLDPISVIRLGMSWCGSENSFLQRIINQSETGKIGRNILPNFSKPFKRFNFSMGVNREIWLQEMLQKRAVFIRIQDNLERNLKLLTNSGIEFKIVRKIKTDSNEFLVLSLRGKAKLDQILPVADYVVQDLSSQELILRGKNLLPDEFKKKKHRIWDVCAGAGGKSILWKVLFPEDEILATDIRPSILNNLKERFRLYDLKGLKTLVFDVRKTEAYLTQTDLFDLILCDVPCSGSGTWGRNPDRFFFFERKNGLAQFLTLQLPLVYEAQKRLRPGGYLFYMTCSVFREENEGVIKNLLDEAPDLICLEQKMISHPEEAADALFLTILKKSV